MAKLRIIFMEPPYHNPPSAAADEKIIFIRDPYTITMVDDARQIVGLDGTQISYETYCLQLQQTIQETLQQAQLDQLERCEAVNIEACKEPPNFRALLSMLANYPLPLVSPCKMTFKNCSFGGRLYTQATSDFIRQMHKKSPDTFFNVMLDESQTSILSDQDRAKLASLDQVAFFPNPTDKAAIRRFTDDSVLGAPKTIFSNPSYLFRSSARGKPSASRLLINFFSQLHQQQSDYTCGPAALKMVADYYSHMGRRLFCGEPIATPKIWKTLNETPELAIAEKVQTTEEVGSEIADMREGLLQIGVRDVIDDCDGISSETNDKRALREHKEKLWDKIQAILSLGIPLIINLRDREEVGHYAVAIGINEKDQIIFAEPAGALTGQVEFETISKDAFIERWKNMDGTRHGRFFILPPNEASTQKIEEILHDCPYYLNGEERGRDQDRPSLA